MTTEELAEAIKVHLKEHLTVETNVRAVYARRGHGKWSEIVTTVCWDDETICQHTGSVDLSNEER